jgi:hypothetical protein
MLALLAAVVTGLKQMIWYCLAIAVVLQVLAPDGRIGLKKTVLQKT